MNMMIANARKIHAPPERVMIVADIGAAHGIRGRCCVTSDTELRKKTHMSFDISIEIDVHCVYGPRRIPAAAVPPPRRSPAPLAAAQRARAQRSPCRRAVRPRRRAPEPRLL